MRYIRTGSFKRLFSIKRRSLDEEPQRQIVSVGVHNDGTISKNFPETEPPQRPTWKCFSYEEIFEATNGFSSDNLVGKGGYAEVYRGILQDGQAIAVKRLSKSSSNERKEKEFLTEIGTLGHVCHPNVSSLLGCCIDNGLYIIFQFSSRGSVASLLHDENLPAMDWKTRFRIAVGTARGLHYLHKGCPRRIIHRDIKASNILLTANFEPQISDFGLAKWLPSQWTHHSIVPIEGTFGCSTFEDFPLSNNIPFGYGIKMLIIYLFVFFRHLAPEYFMHGVVDEKTDVFAFGVFLLEIISGKKPVDGSHQSLHSWVRTLKSLVEGALNFVAKPLLKQGETEELVDPRLEGAYNADQLSRLAFAASLCIRASSTWRPTMSEVLEVMVGEEIEEEKWKMPEGEEDQEEFWGFEDLECECGSPFSTSPHDSTSTRSS